MGERGGAMSRERAKQGYTSTSSRDNLNAKVALGTVTNVKDACAWLGYTYLFVRMKMNPLAYGIGWDEDTMRSGKWSNGAEMTDEEALAEQHRMFVEARARMNGGAKCDIHVFIFFVLGSDG